MTSIKGYIDLLYSGMAGVINEPQKGFLQRVKNNADRLTILVNALLDISRLDAGVIKLDPQSINPLDVMHNVVEELRPRAREREQSLEMVADAPLPFVRADPQQVVRILTNLVDNALKYTPPGGTVLLRAKEDGGNLCFSVQDTGIGISAADQEKLFTRFFRTERAVQSGAGGAGLGLYITRSLVELHGGDISVESSEDKGSTFTFRLPVATEEERVPDDQEFRTISYRSQDRQILVVEDKSDIAAQIARQLQNLGGYRVHVAKRGSAALDYVSGNRRRIDLIALDLHLPDMEGGDLLKALQARMAARQIPVIAIAKNASCSDQERRRLLELGVVRLLVRPFEIADLVREIAQALPDGEKASLKETV
jgi:CheY-like chemotaxis protein/two-component sensor histidine kinase